jgi:hypothetical protein
MDHNSNTMPHISCNGHSMYAEMHGKDIPGRGAIPDAATHQPKQWSKHCMG